MRGTYLGQGGTQYPSVWTWPGYPPLPSVNRLKTLPSPILRMRSVKKLDTIREVTADGVEPYTAIIGENWISDYSEGATLYFAKMSTESMKK